MKKYLFLLLFLTATTLVYTQQKKITLEEIWQGAFSTKGMDALRSMNDGNHYTLLDINRANGTSSIVKYEYETLQQTETILASSPANGIPYFTSYSFNEDESKILLATEVESIYRHSRKAVYLVYDVASRVVKKISDEKIMAPLLSPDGLRVAYVFENNLFILHLSSGNREQITTDGEKNTIN